MSPLDLLAPWHGALIAAALSLAVALAARRLGRPGLAVAAAGIGVLAGWWYGLGQLTASPRHLAERLPLLMLVAVLLAPVGTRRAWLGWPVLLLVASWAGWWMGGAPRWPPDLLRAAPLAGGIAVLALALALAARMRAAMPIAAAALAGGLYAAALPGPQAMLGAALFAAVAAAALVPARGAAPRLLALPAAAGLAALAALPLVARGAPADWAAAAAPAAALLLGGPAGARLAGARRAARGAALGGALAGAGLVLAAWALR